LALAVFQFQFQLISLHLPSMSALPKRIKLSSARLQWLVFVMLVSSLPGFFIHLDPQLQFKISVSNHADCPPAATAVSLKIADEEQPRLNNLQWCPLANCSYTDLCQPCRRRFLIVIATPRSASTTLTWMLNELPGVRMAGENNNMLKSILETKNNIYNHSYFHKGNGVRTAWGHNPIPQQSFSCAAQAMMEAINPPKLKDLKFIENKQEELSEIVGFKTIRFERGPQGHYTQMVEFVKENFPCSRILININSNVSRQALSFRNARFYDVSENSLRRRNRALAHIHELFGDHQSYLIDSAKWTQNVDVLNDAVEWLGFHKSCRFRELLQFNTEGTTGFVHGKTDLSYQDPECLLLG
jgi:hypothetical protein